MSVSTNYSRKTTSFFFLSCFDSWNTLYAKGTKIKKKAQILVICKFIKKTVITKSNVGFFFFTLGIPNGTHSDDEHEPHEHSCYF